MSDMVGGGPPTGSSCFIQFPISSSFTRRTRNARGNSPHNLASQPAAANTSHSPAVDSLRWRAPEAVEAFSLAGATGKLEPG